MFVVKGFKDENPRDISADFMWFFFADFFLNTRDNVRVCCSLGLKFFLSLRIEVREEGGDIVTYR